MTARILPLTPDLIPAAAALEALCFSDAVSEAALREFVLSAANHYYAVLSEGGALLGYGGFSIAADEAEIITAAVAPDARRQGIARALMMRMLGDAVSCGGAVMYLEVRASNTPARSLYASLGFEQCGMRKNYYRAPREDAVLMRKSLREY